MGLAIDKATAIFDRDDPKPQSLEGFHGGHGADPMQWREHDLDLIKARRRHQALLAAQVEVSLVRRLIQPVDPASPNRLRPRHLQRPGCSAESLRESSK